MWKKEVGRKKEKGQENRRKENSGRASAKEILEMEKSIWKSRAGEDTNAKGLGPYNRVKGRLHA